MKRKTFLEKVADSGNMIYMLKLKHFKENNLHYMSDYQVRTGTEVQ